MPIKLLGVKYGKGTATHRAPANHARCCWFCAFGTVVNQVRSVYMEEQKPKGSGMEKIATFIVDKRNLFFLLYAFALIFSIVATGWVKVENDIRTQRHKRHQTARCGSQCRAGCPRAVRCPDTLPCTSAVPQPGKAGSRAGRFPRCPEQSGGHLKSFSSPWQSLWALYNMYAIKQFY